MVGPLISYPPYKLSSKIRKLHKNMIRYNRVNRGDGYEGRQTSKGELFVTVFGMSRDFEGAHRFQGGG